MRTVADVVVVTHPLGGALTLHRLAESSRLAAVVKELACDDAKHARFPGPNPVSLDTGHFAALRKQSYYACEKTDGVRFLLVCCKLDGLSVCALLDRAMTAYLLPLQRVPKAMFQGSLLDGELVWNRDLRRWDYLVFDGLCVSGIPVLHGTLAARMAAVHRALSVYSPALTDPVTVCVKTFVRMSGIDAHLAAAQAAYDVDGIILTPSRMPVVYGRHNAMFKVKFDARHTVDFMVGPDGRQLCVFDSGTHAPVGTLQDQAAPGSIVECRLLRGQTWECVTVRTDKTTANDMFTYKKTMLNMKEGLTLDDVKRVFAPQ